MPGSPEAIGPSATGQDGVWVTASACAGAPHGCCAGRATPPGTGAVPTGAAGAARSPRVTAGHRLLVAQWVGATRCDLLRRRGATEHPSASCIYSLTACLIK